ncbi:MAG: CDP-alcohol phosphatidyltransferase family protein [Prevotellaceae bacterium]|nr:CDP-alcohol phosphatidyltransferase family protein [Prevotellaceae bacterium]
MNYRDFLQKVIYSVINPIIKVMICIGVTPNIVTFVGFVLNVAAAAIFIIAAIDNQMLSATPLALIGWGGGILLVAGLFDMMDGRLARLGNMSSTFGALWDSTLDRYSELFSLFGITFYFLLTADTMSGIVTFLALIGSVMVSYVRARAEGLQIECKVGLMQRPERVVLTALGAILTGCTGEIIYLIVPMWLIAILANITAFWRIIHCYNKLKKQ